MRNHKQCLHVLVYVFVKRYEGYIVVFVFADKENKKPEKSPKKPTKKRKATCRQNILVVTKHGGTKPQEYTLPCGPTSELETLCSSSPDTAPVLPVCPIAPRTTLCFSSSLSPLSPQHNVTPSPPTLLLSPHFVPTPPPLPPPIPRVSWSENASLEVSCTTTNHSEKLSGRVAGTGMYVMYW